MAWTLLQLYKQPKAKYVSLRAAQPLAQSPEEAKEAKSNGKNTKEIDRSPSRSPKRKRSPSPVRINLVPNLRNSVTEVLDVTLNLITDKKSGRDKKIEAPVEAGAEKG